MLAVSLPVSKGNAKRRRFTAANRSLRAARLRPLVATDRRTVERGGHCRQGHGPAGRSDLIARLIEWLTLGAGIPGCMHGGGSPDGAKMVVFAQTDFQQMIDAAKRIGGISDISLAKPPGK